MRNPSLLTALLLLAFAACGGDGTEPDDDDNQGDGVQEFDAALDPDNIVGYDPVSTATGAATFQFDSASSTLTFSLSVYGMDNIIGAHVHAPASPTDNANIPLVLFAPSSPTGSVNGQLAAGTVTEDSPLIIASDFAQILEWMRTGQAYVMVHSSEYPGGEIRGHVIVEEE